MVRYGKSRWLRRADAFSIVEGPGGVVTEYHLVGRTYLKCVGIVFFGTVTNYDSLP